MRAFVREVTHRLVDSALRHAVCVQQPALSPASSGQHITSNKGVPITSAFTSDAGTKFRCAELFLLLPILCVACCAMDC